MPDAWTTLLTGVLVPVAAIVVSAMIAIRLAQSERTDAAAAREIERAAAADARAQERADRVCEDVLESLSFFVSVNPLAEDMAPSTRRLRSRVVLLQSLPDARHRLLGEWLAAEVEAGLPHFTDGMHALGPYLDPGPDDILAVFAPAHRAFHQVLIGLASWMRGEVTDEVLRARIDELKPLG